MSKGNRAAVYVNSVHRKFKLTNATQHLNRKCFVDFEQVDIGNRKASLGKRPSELPERVPQTNHPVPCRPRGVRDDSCDRLQSVFFLKARDVTTTAAAPSLIIEALPAVTEPPLWNAGIRDCRRSIAASARGPSSRLMTLSPERCEIVSRNNFVLKTPCIDGSHGSAMAFERETILIGSRHVRRIRQSLSNQTHGSFAECACQSLMQHTVHQLFGHLRQGLSDQRGTARDSSIPILLRR